MAENLPICTDSVADSSGLFLLCGNKNLNHINGNFRILKWRYVSTICLAIFFGDIPYIGLKNMPYIW